jgi:Uma2 family endonuclease
VELLEGWVVFKMPHNPPHDGTIGLVEHALRPHVLPGWYIRIQMAITTQDSEPEPDIVVALGGPRSYLNRHPSPTEIALLIEVADSSRLRDQREKSRIYARAGIQTYWIVNLVDRRLEVRTQPSGPTGSPVYAGVQNFGPGETVSIELGGNTAQISVDDLLP